ncbi:adenylate/guanylate cyclase domain-containing protein [Bradyrhizobium sp. sBnM-33]|uniref:adenylate/guanylate cyclase domain-containing protein n=1 Tax=Bradyrhizobium sp. sBnM-33 TaxID=2831780 RepID=UPI001BD1640F|nr:adenylate/guanylate cyclase domain-containing protein [Bradyrhizobium sp. sBnM-33]WOH51627.1 adenylate/guanylate cyclase domain-containing protein [Bradyrhizobium sp. sBnM-33]
MTREQRRLAAIFAADVVGYSRLMGRDESGTVARLREHRKLHLEPVLADHGGRLVKLIGDGALVKFASAVDALGAAIEFQQVMAEANRDQPQDDAIVFRIGLHLGDLIVDGDDLYGDGVNVAARLEAEAQPGGIVISGDVHNAVAGRLKATFVALGELSLKNIERPVRAFGVQMDGIPATAAPPHATDVLLTLPDKPSVAVLPFENMSRDPEQEYFVDGLVEDIITGLSSFKSLFVIARNSTFAYKGKSPDIRQVGRELGVRYVLEGSVRKVGNRIRITGQLIDAANGTHLWADRFDGALEDVFELQDRVTENVVGIIAPRVEQAEIERARSKPARNLKAYDLVLRAVALTRTRRRPEVEQALGLLRQAVQIDPSYARGMANLSLCCWIFIAQGFGHRDTPLVADNEVAQRAVALDPADSEVVAIAALILGVSGDMETGLALVEKAIGLNRNNAEAFRVGGNLYAYRGEIDRAVEHLQQCERLNPLDAGWSGSVAYPIAYFGAAIMRKSWIGQRASFASAPMSRARFATARRASLFSAAHTRRGRSSLDCSSMRQATPYPRCAGTTSST